MNAGEKLEITIDEYQRTFSDIAKSQEINEDQRFEILKQKLSQISGWTTSGAEEIISLAREYGGFMLRNALAIAYACDIEDGELGF